MGSHTRNVLTVKAIAANKSAKLRDGGGLWLVTKGAGRYWILDYRFGGKRRELGLGPLHTVGLAEARQRAENARLMIRQGVDPIEHKRGIALIEAARDVPVGHTFGDYADAYIAAAVKAGRWRGAKTEAGWRNTLTNHAAPIRGRALADIGVQDVLSVLRPLWGTKQETAEKLRERIERVLDAAKVEGLRDGENPAAWRGNLEHVLHKPNALDRTTHHPAMPWKEAPAFMKTLRGIDTIAARALEFTILTAVRTGETRFATWSQFDLDKKIWTVPAGGMKGGKEHRKPLPARALAIVKEMQEKRINEFVFPGAKAKRPLSENTLNGVLDDNGGGAYTTHGFRSTFRDWVTEATGFDSDLAEMALAHKVGDAVARAYARSDALEKRRELMVAWETCCGSGWRPGS